MNTFEISSIFIGTVLRLAVPVILTVLVVGLLRYLDGRWQAEALHQATTVGGMRIPVQNLNCWDIHDCPPERKSQCPTYLNPSVPCWEAHNVNGQLQEACLGCAFHKAKISVKTSAIQ